MTRPRRYVVPGSPHHVTHRGNRGGDLFFRDQDFLVYLKYFRAAAEACGLGLQAYALMTNHVHLIVVPEAEGSLPEAMKRCHVRYTQYANKVTGQGGALFQPHLYVCVLGGEHYARAVRYVERNPVRAGLVQYAEDYRFSSAAAHCGLRADVNLTGDPPPLETAFTWQEWLREDDPEAVAMVRKHSRSGLPLGDPAFAAKIREQFGIGGSRRPGRPFRAL